MIRDVRMREAASAIVGAVVWVASARLAGYVAGVDLARAVLVGATAYGAVEMVLFWRGTPLRRPDLDRIALLALWTGASYVTFDLGCWYALPLALIVVGVVLSERAPAGARSYEPARRFASPEAPAADDALAGEAAKAPTRAAFRYGGLHMGPKRLQARGPR